MVQGIKNIQISLGSEHPRTPTQGESINYISLGKSICTSKDLKAGTTISNEDLILLSPGDGLKPSEIENVIGKKIKVDLAKSSKILLSHLQSDDCDSLNLKFQIPWGIPVRFHDAYDSQKV